MLLKGWDNMTHMGTLGLKIITEMCWLASSLMWLDKPHMKLCIYRAVDECSGGMSGTHIAVKRFQSVGWKLCITVLRSVKTAEDIEFIFIHSNRSLALSSSLELLGLLDFSNHIKCPALVQATRHINKWLHGFSHISVNCGSKWDLYHRDYALGIGIYISFGF